MKLALLFFIVCLVSSSLANPPDNALLLRQRREVDFIGSTQLLIKELIENLQSAIQRALDAAKSFSDGLQEQAKEYSEKIINDLKNFGERVNNAIKSITDRFTEASAAVQTCTDSFRTEAEKIFAETEANAKNCADEREQEIGEMIENLKLLASNATEFASTAMDELRSCRENSTGFLSSGSCLGGVAVRTEIQGAVFLTQSGLLITRINLALTTLPAALEICAGTGLVAAGISSAKIVVEISTCSASSVYSSLTGNDLA